MPKTKDPFVRPAEVEDALSFAPYVRRIDKLEIKYSHDIEPTKALLTAFTLPNAKNFSIVDDDGFIYAMFGVSDDPTDKRCGVAWLLSSEKLKKFPRRFYIESRYWIAILQNNYEYIYNYVYGRNWLTLKWLQLCGFKALKQTKIGKQKKNFILMARGKTTHVQPNSNSSN